MSPEYPYILMLGIIVMLIGVVYSIKEDKKVGALIVIMAMIDIILLTYSEIMLFLGK